MLSVTYVSIILCLFLFCFADFSPRFIFFFVCFFSVAFMVEKQLASRSFLLMLLFMLLFSKIDVTSFLKFDIFLKSLICLSVIILCKLGLIENFSAYINGTFKQSFGFSHPNSLTCFILSIAVEIICINFRNFTPQLVLLVFLLFSFAYFFGGGRSSSYAFIFVAILALLMFKFPSFFSLKLVSFISSLCMFFCFYISFFAARLYPSGNPFSLMLNRVLTGRIYYASYFLSCYKVLPFGQKIDFVGTRASSQYLGLDNSYIRFSLLYGYIFIFFILIIYSVLIYRLLRIQSFGYAVLVIFYSFVGIGEPYTFDFVYNISLLFLAKVILNNDCFRKLFA